MRSPVPPTVRAARSWQTLSMRRRCGQSGWDERPCPSRIWKRVSRRLLPDIEKKDAGVSGDEKKIVSYHEIGHALVAALQTHSAPVHKITIVPRTSGALRIYDAGGGGSALPDEQGRGVQQDCDTDRRPCGGGADLPFYHDRGFRMISNRQPRSPVRW